MTRFRDDDLTILAANPVVDAVLKEMCALTGMGFSAIARVTPDRWIACQVEDRIGFGLEPGGELEIKTTICDEIRASREAVFIDDAHNSSTWWNHPTPRLYGFRSYVSVPLFEADDAFFGTLCAIDPEPHIVDTVEMRAAIDGLASRVMDCLR